VGWYDTEVRSLLESFAGQISFALDKFDAQAQVQAQQQRVLDTSAHLQQVFEATPVPMQIYTGAQQRLRFINQAHRQWLGYELQEIATLEQWLGAMGYTPQECDEQQQLWDATVARLQGDQVTVALSEFALRSKDGARKVARPTATRVGDDILLVWADLTDIRHQEAELRDSEKRFRSMVEHAVSGMYVRRDNQLIYVNDSFCRMLGRPAEELLGHDVSEFMAASPQEWQRVQQAREQVQTGGRHVVAEATVRHKDGSLIEVGFSISPIQWDDGQPAVIGLAEDITVRKRAAEQIAGYVQRLEESLQATLRVVSTMVEMRDPYTAGHERRVGLVAAAIAQELGWPAERCKTMEMVGLVHDIGKIAVPAEILTKPTRLTSIELRLVQEHAQMGYEILKDVPFDAPVAEIIRQHHERMDGSGYPRGLLGNDILPEARVLAVADVLESMAAHRPYRPALGLDVALQELVQNQGRLYDPVVVEATARLIRDKGYVLPE
jgi:PAS domain S-box-containing protein/putative nucleotidyltransferase with HDIG domain